MTVISLAKQLDLDQVIGYAARSMLSFADAELLLQRLAALPVKRSHALQRLGSYVARGAEPLAIRLQFAQESRQLTATFLHEVAHACDHLSHQSGKPYRRAHGPGWQAWMAALGQPADTRGASTSLAELRTQRLKVVAVCRSCGAEIRRLRRLDRRKRYIHTDCGGRLQPV